MRCFRCGYDGSAEDFYPRRDRKNPVRAERRAECKSCTDALSRQGRERMKARSEAEREQDTPDGKVCPRCDEWCSREEFSISRSEKDGLQRWCRDCQATYYQERRARAAGAARR